MAQARRGSPKPVRAPRRDLVLLAGLMPAHALRPGKAHVFGGSAGHADVSADHAQGGRGFGLHRKAPWVRPAPLRKCRLTLRRAGVWGAWAQRRVFGTPITASARLAVPAVVGWKSPLGRVGMPARAETGPPCAARGSSLHARNRHHAVIRGFQLARQTLSRPDRHAAGPSPRRYRNATAPRGRGQVPWQGTTKGKPCPARALRSGWDRPWRPGDGGAVNPRARRSVASTATPPAIPCPRRLRSSLAGEGRFRDRSRPSPGRRTVGGAVPGTGAEWSLWPRAGEAGSPSARRLWGRTGTPPDHRLAGAGMRSPLAGGGSRPPGCENSALEGEPCSLWAHGWHGMSLWP